MRKFRYSILVFFLLLCFLLVTTLHAENKQPKKPHFTDIIVTTSDTHLLFFGELQNSVTDEMIDGLHSGIPITFIFYAELIKNVDNWVDENLVTLEFSHKLSYDTLKQHYVIETEETSKKQFTTQSLAEASQIANEVNGLKIYPLSNLQPDGMYRLRVKADLNKITLPMRLHSILPFVSWWDLDTDWYTVEFTY